MPLQSRERCVDCRGNGKCSMCKGTGVNIHLNEAEPKCQKCSGTGVCPTCQGTGRWYVLPPEIQDPGFNKL
jgi:hypothetical protein